MSKTGKLVIEIGDAILIKQKYVFTDDDPSYYIEHDIGICISELDSHDYTQKFYLINSRVIALEQPDVLFYNCSLSKLLLTRYDES